MSIHAAFTYLLFAFGFHGAALAQSGLIAVENPAPYKQLDYVRNAIALSSIERAQISEFLQEAQRNPLCQHLTWLVASKISRGGPADEREL